MNTTLTTAAVCTAEGQTSELLPVLAIDFGADSQPMRPLDHERELLIKIEGLHVEREMSIWARTGDFGAHGAATKHLGRMQELIKGRSPDVQARMAAERGLPHA